MSLPFAALRRWPDVEADNLQATDAADRLILHEAAPLIQASDPGRLAVIGDGYGALTLGAAAAYGATSIRTHQDALSGERALAANAERLGLADRYRSFELGPDVLTGATLVLLRLPRSLDALDELAETIARYADPSVTVMCGGRVKHMTRAMNDVLLRHFATLDVSLARQKSRLLTARKPRPQGDPPSWPRASVDPRLGLTVVAHGAAFAGAAIDGGTRLLIDQFDGAMDAAEAIDLGCGTGVLATEFARRRPRVRVVATDQSTAAVASARATANANGVADRVTVVRDDALGSRSDASAPLILLNPPFHIGASVHAGAALKLFADVGRVLAAGGELWTVWNSHLRYRGQLGRLVGPTRQVARDATFTVSVSTRG